MSLVALISAYPPAAYMLLLKPAAQVGAHLSDALLSELASLHDGLVQQAATASTASASKVPRVV